MNKNDCKKIAKAIIKTAKCEMTICTIVNAEKIILTSALLLCCALRVKSLIK